jgi:hypothetical protein
VKSTAAVLLVTLLGGCGHASSTAPAPSTAGAAAGEQAPEPKRLPTGDGASGLVTTTPAGLLVPGGEAQIRGRLVAKGFLARGASASAAEGLRRFQEANGLPATGLESREDLSTIA